MQKRERDIHLKQRAYFQRVEAVGAYRAKFEESSQRQSQVYKNSRPCEFVTGLTVGGSLLVGLGSC